MDGLPEYMKLIYEGLLDIYKEMEEIMACEGKSYHLSYAIESVSFYTFSEFAIIMFYNQNSYNGCECCDHVFIYR